MAADTDSRVDRLWAELFGNSHPGLRDRVLIVEQTMKQLMELEGQRKQDRREWRWWFMGVIASILTGVAVVVITRGGT